ncbi:hypothetical protein XaraCFBP7407_10030 [Xanthomonas arboricola pv. arracaciae]|nr:hypothetical protein XaraCFBP7407_10030 [Xanthomonas arboricola pv. arracaciae]
MGVIWLRCARSVERRAPGRVARRGPDPHPNPAPRPGPRWQPGRSQARAPVARKLCLIAPGGEGLGSWGVVGP